MFFCLSFILKINYKFKNFYKIKLFFIKVSVPVVFVLDPELNKECLKDTESLKCPLAFYGKHFWNRGLLLSNGEDWKRQRNLLSKCFNFEALKQKLPIIK